ncbi:MAG: hypothetical protein ACOX85_10955 [Candidatus Pararuminococcus gallinarum]|jgi:hypothetical protein
MNNTTNTPISNELITTLQTTETPITLPEDVYQCAKSGNVKGAVKRLEFYDSMGLDLSAPNLMVEHPEGDEDIPMDERAVVEIGTDTERAIMSIMNGTGAFVGGRGFVPVEGTDDRVLACIVENEKGTKVLKVMLARKDGTFFPTLEIAHADFVMACEYNFALPEKNNLFYGDIMRFQKNTIRGVVDRLPCDAGMDYMGVLNALKSSYRQLPIHRHVPNGASVATIYQAIMGYAYRHNSASNPLVGEAYFRLDRSDMEKIAEDLEMTTKAICIELKEHGFLYLTESSKGFQTKVRVDGLPMDRYCIRKPRTEQIKAVESVPATELESGVLDLHDGRVQLSYQKYKEFFGEEEPCQEENPALQSPGKEEDT